MRLWEPEVDQKSIAEVLGEVAVQAGNDGGADVLVGAHDVAQLLWIESRGEGHGLDELAEEDRELAALGVARGP